MLPLRLHHTLRLLWGERRARRRRRRRQVEAMRRLEMGLEPTLSLGGEVAQVAGEEAFPEVGDTYVLDHSPLL